MKDWHRRYAEKILLINSSLDYLYEITKEPLIKSSFLMISSFQDMGDCVWYNETPIIDHKYAWGNVWDYNYISDTSPTKKNVIIYNPDSTIYATGINDDEPIEYQLDIEDPEAFLFQMSLVENRHDEFCILYALHELKMANFTFIYMWEESILDYVIDQFEHIIDVYCRKRDLFK